jgi:hypothetical protein
MDITQSMALLATPVIVPEKHALQVVVVPLEKSTWLSIQPPNCESSAVRGSIWTQLLECDEIETPIEMGIALIGKLDLSAAVIKY